MLSASLLDLIARIRAATSKAALLAELSAILVDFGINSFAFTKIPQPGQSFDEAMLGVVVSEEWLNLWTQKEYHQVDPGILYAPTTAKPFVYSSEFLSPTGRSLEVIRAAEDFGLHRGVMVPVSGVRGIEGLVWFNGAQLEPLLPVLQVIGLYAFERMQELSDRPQPQFVSLTPREREVLSWFSLGKSAWEVGEILKISQRTVEWHMDGAMRKLGTVNRTQTVLEALRRGLISP
ncbi:MAG: autoinducer binding domain-containing protein [Bdellovibrionales bacterium]|nr:autoinducer binding domain-containing protein [Bdellovibrionales bacterium]